MTSDEIRAAYLDFFVARDHRRLPSGSLIPSVHDPSVSNRQELWMRWRSRSPTISLLLRLIALLPLPPVPGGRRPEAGPHSSSARPRARAADPSRRTLYAIHDGRWPAGATAGLRAAARRLARHATAERQRRVRTRAIERRAASPCGSER